MVRGGGESILLLDNIPLQEDVRAGDEVVTAGIDGVFPRGIPIGTVIDVVPGPELFHRIRVRPHIDFGLLDQVYVLTEEVVPSEIKAALSSEALSSEARSSEARPSGEPSGAPAPAEPPPAEPPPAGAPTPPTPRPEEGMRR